MKSNSSLILTLLLLLAFPCVLAAHFIVGYVEDAKDGTSPNGRLAILWNPSIGSSDNITGIIGPSGPSLTSNVYMIDCELLNNSCSVGNFLSVTLVNDSSGYFGINSANVTVTGAGFDVASNLSMNSPPIILNITADDIFSSPAEEIDLTPAGDTMVFCTGVIEELDGLSTLNNITAQFYRNTSSFGASDDNNLHYTNNSCNRDDSFGNSNQTLANCSLQIQYYANAGNWTCTFNATDSLNASSNLSDTVSINTLLAVGVNDTLNFGALSPNSVSQEEIIQIINYGNVMINLSLSSYGNMTEDGNAMNCGSQNITAGFLGYNLTHSNLSTLTYQQFDILYKNMTGSPVIEPFNLNNRQDDLSNDALSDIYWRIFVPATIGEPCQGNIIIGAAQT